MAVDKLKRKRIAADKTRMENVPLMKLLNLNIRGFDELFCD